jgi:N-acetylneuraminic acid mutarotase
MPTAREHTAYAVVDGKLHVVGGRPGAITAHEVYDPATDAWMTAASLPLGRSSFAGVALGGQLVVFGGEDAAEARVYADAEAYDPASNRWTSIAPLPVPVQGIGAAVVNGAVYLPGGGPSGGPAEQTNRLQILSAP